ncbi:MAG TPA: hypothetical protein VN639_16395, partial [Azonexus sp.]|nr:hypothetical protein [Azonexus sp.]
MLDDDVRFRLINQRYPHIGKRILELWETQELGDYIDKLLGDTRGGTRAGFPQDVVAMLEALRIAHLRLHPHVPPALSPTPNAAATALAENDNFKIVDERFPHIGKKLAGLWSSHDFSVFINELFQDTRGGTRQGFPKEVSVALFRLMQDHDRLYPDVAYEVQDI